MLLFPLPAQIYFYNPHAIPDLAEDYSSYYGLDTLERSFFLLDARRKTGSVLFLIFGLAATVPER